MHDNEADVPQRERLRVLIELENLLEGPMLVLGFVWLGLLVLELAMGAARS